MDVSLDRLFQQIHPSWLEAAKALLPQVGSLEWPYEGTVRADVREGEEIHETLVDLDGDLVISYSCTCDSPDPICLHVLAVLIKIVAADV